MLGATASDAPPGAELYPAAKHYWDGDGQLIRGYRKTLGLDEPAWDIYMIYPPGVRWEKAPPLPAYWMHQLGARGHPRVKITPFLDPGVFADRLRQIVASDSAHPPTPH